MAGSKDRVEEFTDDMRRFDNLEWIRLEADARSSLPREEGLKEKLVRKTKENPLVPIGAAATTFALCYGLYCMKSGKTKMSQYMMRFRVAAQGFTIAALVIGIGLGAMKKQQP